MYIIICIYNIIYSQWRDNGVEGATVAGWRWWTRGCRGAALPCHGGVVWPPPRQSERSRPVVATSAARRRHRHRRRQHLLSENAKAFHQKYKNIRIYINIISKTPSPRIDYRPHTCTPSSTRSIDTRHDVGETTVNL